ncbi:acyl-CoA/acyl-ACP dehydrogenase [Kribbella sp. NBC_01505]|uniref:acyl-CoA dehydrogenase family protein n=1 Tax=Kribbella sp. NBC_01505 TaxID=2903580 RepID=UPI00386BCC2B
MIDAELLARIAQRAAELDQESRFPAENLAELRAGGLLGLAVPAVHGTPEAFLTELVTTARAIGGVCLSTAMIWAMHCQQVDAIVRHGTSGLRDRLLPRVIRGEVYIASVTTDRSGGSSLTGTTSTASGGARLAIDRDAPVVTGGTAADGFLLTVRRDSSTTPGGEVSLLYVDAADLVLEPTDSWDMLGMRATASGGLRLKGSTPADAVVGAGTFQRVADDSLVPLAHIGWSACWLGAAENAFTQLVARLLKTAGKPGSPLESDLLNERVARIRVDLELVSSYLRTVTAEVATARTAGRVFDRPADKIHLNTLKLAASELCFRAADRMVQLSGLAVGYNRLAPSALERTFRDLRSAALNFSNDKLWVGTGALSLLDRGVHLA